MAARGVSVVYDIGTDVDRKQLIESLTGVLSGVSTSAWFVLLSTPPFKPFDMHRATTEAPSSQTND